MSGPLPKYVNDNHYHLWTDALHGRTLAHQAANKWDRATYVRWTIVTAWTVLEVACQEAFSDKDISYRFKENLVRAVKRAGLSALEWGRGVWQRVSELQDQRNSLMHRFATEHDLFPDAEVADEAIEIVREAVKAIYEHARKPVPGWIDDREDRGWASLGLMGSVSLTVIEAGVDPEADDTIRVLYVREGEENTTQVMAPEKDWKVEVEKIRTNIRVPISGLRAYRGKELIYEEKVRMRGSDDA